MDQEKLKRAWIRRFLLYFLCNYSILNPNSLWTVYFAINQACSRKNFTKYLSVKLIFFLAAARIAHLVNHCHEDGFRSLSWVWKVTLFVSDQSGAVMEALNWVTMIECNLVPMICMIITQFCRCRNWSNKRIELEGKLVFRINWNHTQLTW